MICEADPRIISCLPTHVIYLVINDNSLEILYIYKLFVVYRYYLEGNVTKPVNTWMMCVQSAIHPRQRITLFLHKKYIVYRYNCIKKEYIYIIIIIIH